MQVWTPSSGSAPGRPGPANNTPCHHYLVPSSSAPGHSPLCCCWGAPATDPVSSLSPSRSKTLANSVCCCPSSVHQDIGRGSVTGDREGRCLPLNLGLSPRAERGWPRSSQNHTVHCGVSHRILKGTMTPPLLPEKIMNHCIRLSLITALKLYDSKY